MSHIFDTAEMLRHHMEVAVLELLAPYRDPVLVAGAFHGATCEVLHLFDPNVLIHGFEPQSDCWGDLARVRDAVPGFRFHPVALGLERGTASLFGAGTDAASMVSDLIPGGRQEIIEVEDAREYLPRINPSGRWRAWLINMEGYEYQLLPALDDAGLLDGVENLIVQYHPGNVPDGDVPYEPRGFVRAWDCFPTWVWWRRRDS